MSVYGQILAASGGRHWQEAVSAVLGPAEAYSWSVDDNMAAPAIFALPSFDAIVLDASCGRGTRVFALSKVCRQVLAMDPDPNAARFVGLRARQDGCKNVTALVADEESFRVGTLDMVIADEFDQIVQWCRLLRAGGVLCLHFPNSLSPFSWFGQRKGSTLRNGLRRVRREGLTPIRTFGTVKDDEDVRMAIDSTDPRSLQTVLPHFVTRSAAWSAVSAFTVGLVLPGIWIVARN